MSDGRDGKRGKESRRSKKAKRAKKHTLASPTAPSEREAPPSEAPVDDPAQLSKRTQAAVIELQRTELNRLLREQRQLNERIDRLLQLHEREQVLRQQMQAALDRLAETRALPPSPAAEPDAARLLERLDRAENKFNALQSAVGLLVAAIERQPRFARQAPRRP